MNISGAQSLLRSSIPVFSQSFGSWEFSINRIPFEVNELAEKYDEKSHKWPATLDRHGFENAYEKLIGKVLQQKRYRQTNESLRVLDAGIGTGAMSSACRTQLGRGFQLAGIDISEAMLRQAATRLENSDMNLELKQVELTSLPYFDDTFDIILVAHVLEHLADPRKAISELYRVLKPGGIVICCITRRSSVGAYIQFLWRTHQVTIGTALDWLRNCGLKSVRAIPLTKNSRSRKFSIGYVGRKPFRS